MSMIFFKGSEDTENRPNQQARSCEDAVRLKQL